MARDDVFEAFVGLFTQELVEQVHVILFGELRTYLVRFDPEQLGALLGVSAATVAVWTDEEGERERTMTLVNGVRLALFVLVYRRGVPRWLLWTRREGVLALSAAWLEVGSVVIARSLLEWARARLGVLNRSYVTRLIGGGPRSRVVSRLARGDLDEPDVVDEVLLRSALSVCLGVVFATLIPEGSPLTVLARELTEHHGFTLPGVEVMRAAFDEVKEA
jgi:hypothetical protein